MDALRDAEDERRDGAVAIDVRQRQRVERARHPGVAPEDREEDEDHHALDEREGERERDLHEHRLRREAHAGGAREDEVAT